MKHLLIAVFVFGFIHVAKATPAVVQYIIDGDTFVADIVLPDKIEVISINVRLINVDTPEIHGQCASEIKRAEYAKQRLAELIPVGTTVELKNIKNDKYDGRIDANVYDGANRDIGQILIKEKIGRPYNGGRRQSWCKN